MRRWTHVSLANIARNGRMYLRKLRNFAIFYFKRMLSCIFVVDHGPDSLDSEHNVDDVDDGRRD
jgi:hypothetical protein